MCERNCTLSSIFWFGRYLDSVTRIVTIIKSITLRQIFIGCADVKKILWEAEFWIDRYFANTVGKQGDEKMIASYVNNQGKEYQLLHQAHLVLYNFNTPSPLQRDGLFMLKFGALENS